MSNKELIHQYVTTGRKVPEEQVKKLSTNNLSSYLRVRTMGGEKLAPFEFYLLPHEKQSEYLASIDSMDVRVLIQLTNHYYDIMDYLDIILRHPILIKNFNLITLDRVLKGVGDTDKRNLLDELLNNKLFINNLNVATKEIIKQAFK